MKVVDFENKNAQFAMKLGIVLYFQNLHVANFIFKKAASLDLFEVKILIFKLLYHSYFTFDFNLVCGRFHGLLRACISDSLAYKVFSL